RGSRGVALTRRGGELIANARRIVSLLDETAASLVAPPLGGLVRIGIPAEYGRSILSRALGEFAKRHPRVEVTVRYAHSDSQVRALAAGELDLAVVFEWEGFSGGEVLMHDPTVWVTSTLHHMHEERPVPI
ncbi:LysR family transcriptional regulator, partial [bacterium M00.F.Ca.ET.168.01.1.1]